MVYLVDARKLGALDHTKRPPQQWEACVACETARLVIPVSTVAQTEDRGPRYCSLQRVDYGSGRCTACEDAGHSVCLVACKDCRKILATLSEYINTVAGDAHKTELASQMMRHLTPDCASCQQRQGSLNATDLFSDLDNEADEDFAVNDSDLEKLQSSESEDSSDDDKAVNYISDRKRVRDESTSPESKHAPKRPALKAKEKSKVDASYQAVTRAPFPQSREAKKPSDASANQTAAPSGMSPTAGGPAIPTQRCSGCKSTKSMDNFDVFKNGKPKKVCRACLTQQNTGRLVEKFLKKFEATAFDQESDVEEFLEAEDVDRMTSSDSGLSTMIRAIQKRIVAATPEGPQSSWTPSATTQVRALQSLLDRVSGSKARHDGDEAEVS